MKIYKSIIRLLFICTILQLPLGCTDKFDYLEDSPNWLGDNIYDYLKGKGTFNNYLRLIEDCGYTETMQRTGSVTLFVADDEAFTRFYATNKYGIRKYEDMSLSMKYLIIRSGLLNNAYLIEKMCDTESGSKGQILRRTTALSVLDTIPQVTGGQMPATSYWDKYKGKKISLLQDASQWSMVHFIEKALNAKGILNSDLEYISDRPRTENETFIFNTRVLDRDIACKNGYVNILEDVLLPPENMAGYIRNNGDLSEYNNLMGRFCAPYRYSVVTNNATNQRDTIYQLRYFNSGVNALLKSPDATGDVTNGNTVDATLMYDPGWNRIQTSAGNSELYAYDMPAMFVPTNKAMNAYFSPTGLGNDLYDQFKTWDKVPNVIAADFVSNHMKKSFLTALPSQFAAMKDEAGYLMNVSTSDIDSVYISRNGLVYKINKVLPPLDYRTVLGPVKINSTTSIFQKGQTEAYVKFIYYFRSLLNKYSYFATLDANMKDYRDPVAQGYATSNQEKWNFKIADNGNIQAVAYRTKGDSLTITDGRITNRLQDIFDQQTIVGELTDGQEYYITKGGAPVRVKGNVVMAANGQTMFTEGTTLEGGGNIERGTKATVVKTYPKENGGTYFIDGILENPITSAFGALSSNPQFSKFFQLLNQSDIFVSLVSSNAKALNNKVRFFDLFHYTIYVPTNDAIDQAINSGLIPSQSEIDNAETVELQKELSEKRLRFLRYHFQDNSVFIGGQAVENKAYLSSTLNQSNGKFYPLYVTNTNGNLKVRDYLGNTANVIKTSGNYNLMTRDVVVDNADLTAAKNILTSSWAVIHLVDKVLRFQ